MPRGPIDDVHDALRLYAYDLAKNLDIPSYALVITHPDKCHMYFNGADADTIFPIASLSKSFAAALTAILVKDGLLNWDDPISKFDIGFKLSEPKASARLTVRDILSNINPLPPNALDHLTELGFSLENLLNKLELVPISGEFKYSYQNILFSVIKLIIEKITGVSYEECLKQRILEPLCMTQSCLNQQEYEQCQKRTRPHLFKDGKISELPGSNLFFTTQPATGMCMSIRDLGIWLSYCQRNHDVLLKEIFTPLPYADPPYAMGWWQADKQGLVKCHDGSAIGYESHMAIVPSRGYGIAVLTNTSNSGFGRKVINHFVRVVTSLYDFDMFTLFYCRSLERPAISLDSIQGRYFNIFLENITLELEERDGTKNMKISIGPKGITGNLQPFSFTCYSYDARDEILDHRLRPTFKIIWHGHMAASSQMWYPDDIVTVVLNDRDQSVNSLLFLFPNMFKTSLIAHKVSSRVIADMAPQNFLTHMFSNARFQKVALSVLFLSVAYRLR